MYVLWYCFRYWCQNFRRRHWHRWKFCFVLILPVNTHVVGKNNNLKVLSGQIGSAWEWYHWIGIEKNIDRYNFFIFYFKFHFWIFEKTSKFWAASYKNEPNLLLVRIMVCIESFLPIGWRTFFMTKCAKGMLYFGLDCRMLDFFKYTSHKP